jgi:hypothetical protein
MDELIENEHNLHNAAKSMLAKTTLIKLLSKLGKPTITGSYQTRLMVYPDIDFTV